MLDWMSFICRLFLGAVAPVLALQLQDAPGAEALVSSALKHWQQQQRAQPSSEEAAAGVGWCLQRLVTMRLAAGAFNEATDMYLQLHKGAAPQDAASASVLAKLLRAAAASGEQQALAALQKQLPGGRWGL
jgi:hypothetical protein